MADFLQIENGQALPLAAVPTIGLARFARLIRDFTQSGGAIVQFFAHQEQARPNCHRLYAVTRGSGLFALATEVDGDFPSLTLAAGAKFAMFEREIAEQYGIKPTGHPWLKPLRRHDRDYEYFTVKGEGVHEVGVGPVHAGIIEPGHFRFQCAGEEVLHLEIRLGYQHRGLERLFTTAPRGRLPIIAESIAGDTAIGHSLCFCQAIEAMAGIEVDAAASSARVIALELERLANHVGDLGALSGDVAFAPPAAYFGRIRGEFLNLLLLMSGNRFGKSLVRPGGVGQALGPMQFDAILEKIAELRPQLKQVCDLLFTAHTVTARFERAGLVNREIAERLGLVGPCARASGLEYDAREFFPSECYATLPGNVLGLTQGDVLSRALVRRDEIFHSLNLVETLAQAAADCQAAADWRACSPAPEHLVVTVNEGWRGEISHCLITDAAGRIARYKIKDPSFHNWMGLAMALRGQGISDFPLCNKSFNLSYCGFDL
ncbi:MAG: hydrogenase [Desulfobulbaceae bacterium]|jgi:Ni,Fe-hydrogenase III large subunit|nr:hydrogenase [Desulfobulbaceae bacterium]